MIFSNKIFRLYYYITINKIFNIDIINYLLAMNNINKIKNICCIII